MQKSEWSRTILALVKDQGVVPITTIMRAIHFTEDLKQQADVYEVIYSLVKKGHVVFDGDTNGYVILSSLNCH